MGLDMYLEKAKRIEHVTAEQLGKINDYLSYLEEIENGSNYTSKEWYGINVEDLDMNLVENYKDEYIKRYQSWDNEKKYGHNTIFEQVGYWRKANAIHKWFVDNVQNGIDDCCYHEVTKENIQELLRRCKIIKGASTMEKAYIENGKTFANDQWCPIYIEGETISNPNIAKNLLPTQEGFFFGGTNYDQWYMNDITATIDILQKVLDETDFDREMIVYCSSW